MILLLDHRPNLGDAVPCIVTAAYQLAQLPEVVCRLTDLFATRPGARFRRLARRFGRLSINKAAVAVAHTLLCIAWAVMKHDTDYTEAGADYYDQPSPGSATR